jgi:hypothetical protein
VYSVQGNILTGAAVLDQAASAFEADACDLAERLMRALEAGAEHGQGDSRCTGAGIPSDSAFIEVDRPDETAGSYLRLSVADTAPESPLPKLRALFDAWRATHPCAVRMPVAGAAAGSGAAAGGVSGTIAGAGTSGFSAAAGAFASAGGSGGSAVAGASGMTWGAALGGGPGAAAGLGALAGMSSAGAAAISGKASPGAGSAAPSAGANPSSGLLAGATAARAAQTAGAKQSASGPVPAARSSGGCSAVVARARPCAYSPWLLAASGLACALTRARRRRGVRARPPGQP